MALPSGARIKLRVSAGVFEVTLCRVVEESKSVEVLWDRGLKREFKWGSVVFGSTELVVGHKPTEAAPEPERKSLLYSVCEEYVGQSIPRFCGGHASTANYFYWLLVSAGNYTYVRCASTRRDV